MTTVHVKRDRLTGDALINFDYDAFVVECIKDFPSWSRRWDAKTRSWSLFESYVGELIALLRSEGHEVIDSFTRRKMPPPSTSRSATWADIMLDAVGPDRVEIVHRLLSKALHPDTPTGDTALMQQLNTARDRRMVA